MDAEMTRGEFAATGCNAIVKLAVVAPAGTVTLAGSDASVLLELDSWTVAAESAGPLNETVPWTLAPPYWLIGSMLSPVSVYGATTVRVAGCATDFQVAEIVTTVEVT